MKILVVDDELDMRILFEQKFKKEIAEHSIAFAFATSGEEALTYLDKHEHEAVLILSDINMPGMTGLQLLDIIKHQFSAPIPVVMMITAFGDPENYNEAIKLGADDFLTKPLDFSLLKQKLKTIGA
mgnify:CR=1 FL=1